MLSSVSLLSESLTLEMVLGTTEIFYLSNYSLFNNKPCGLFLNTDVLSGSTRPIPLCKLVHFMILNYCLIIM